jgi:ribosomal protein L37AE/L43A
MKLTVILEKKSRFSIELPEVEAKNLFKSIIGSTVSALKVQTHSFRMQPDQKDIEDKETEAVPKEKTIKAVDTNTRRISQKLVMLKCSGCGETIVGLVKGGQWSLTCKNCKTDNTIEKLKPAAYTCPNCGYKASFYVKDGLDIVKCKNCDSDIDLMYHEKKDKYLSANLIK